MVTKFVSTGLSLLVSYPNRVKFSKAKEMSTQNRSKDFKHFLNITVNSDLKHIRTDLHDP
jgi:hypothetical protein